MQSAYGPHVCGDTIDLHEFNILAGSYNTKDVLTIWDMRKMRVLHKIDWQKTGARRDQSYVYAAMFSKKSGDSIIAGGKGASQVQLFHNDLDNECPPFADLGDLEQSVFTVDVGNK